MTDAVIVVRPARDEDVGAIKRNVDRAYVPYVERIGRQPAPMLDDYTLKLRDAAVLVAEERSKPGPMGRQPNECKVESSAWPA